MFNLCYLISNSTCLRKFPSPSVLPVQDLWEPQPQLTCHNVLIWFIVDKRVSFWARISKCVSQPCYNIPTAISSISLLLHSLETLSIRIYWYPNLSVGQLGNEVPTQTSSVLIWISQLIWLQVQCVVCSFVSWSSSRTLLPNFSNRCFFFYPKCFHPQDCSWLDVVQCTVLHVKPEESSHIWDTWTGGFGCNSHTNQNRRFNRRIVIVSALIF